jgi:aldose 1-epimerase
MPTKTEPYGTAIDGRRVDAVTLTNRNGCIARLISYGATLAELHVPDRTGKLQDVVLGYDNLQGYENGNAYFGATIGRVANRIAKGKFTLNGQAYEIPTNNGPNALHGGPFGYERRIWELAGAQDNQAQFSLTDPNGCMGFPGTVQVQVTFELTDDNALRLTYAAETDAPTPINLTCHAYFNLKDGGKTSIADHIAQINASNYTPVDAELIPTGKIDNLAGTKLDLRQPTPLKNVLTQVGENPPGFDHNFVLDNQEAATIYEPTSGRKLSLTTDQPGVQFYTGNQLNGTQNKYAQYAGFTLEAQGFPDAVNHPNFPNTILNPGDKYTQVTEYRFTTE